MYKIIGVDGKEYGPISAEQIRLWIAEGRADVRTLAQLEGTQEWKPLGSFPEFFPTRSPVTPTGNADAAAQVRLPAILLAVAGGLGMVAALIGLIQNLSGTDLSQLQSLPPNLPPEVERVVHFSVSIPANLINLGLSAVILLGGLGMMKLKNWGLALAAAILAILCGNPCCCPIGLVAGIWSIIVLTKSEVKASFR